MCSKSQNYFAFSHYTINLKLSEGEQIHIIEEDDGTGWVKIENDQGSKGLVPATYIELVPNLNEPSKAVFSSSSLPLKSGQYGRLLIFENKA